MPRLPHRSHAPRAGTPASRRVPWQALWTAGMWLYAQGRERYQRNLTSADQAELRQLMLKSRGRAGKLTPDQRRRLGELIRKGVTGND
jgi:hypothetical protein